MKETRFYKSSAIILLEVSPNETVRFQYPFPETELLAPWKLCDDTSNDLTRVKGQLLMIVAKAGIGKQSSTQRKCPQLVESECGIFHVACDFKSFHHWFHQLFSNERYTN